MHLEFFDEMQRNWSAAAGFFSWGVAMAAVKNCLARDVLEKELVGRNRAFASGKVLGLESENWRARNISGEETASKKIAA